MITLVADIGGTAIKVALMKNHTIVLQDSWEANSREGLAPQLPRIATVFGGFCRQSGLMIDECSAVAIAFPSLIDEATGRVLTAYGKYLDAPDLDLPRWSRETLGLPLVIENDARAALLGEWQAGAGRGCNDLVMVTLGTGLGTAALIEGNLLRGKHGQAGVLGGHLTVRLGGHACTCGNQGCAEAEASTFSLPVIAAQRADFAGSPLQDVEILDYAKVLKFAREGDPCALALRTQAIETWTAMIVNLIHAYDPERVIIGGGILAGKADFLAELELSIHRRAHTPWGRVTIVSALLGDSAALFGGDYLVGESLRRAQ